MEFVLTVNSPGEVSTWLAPVVRALRQQSPGARITVFLVPCAFATGAEASVVGAMPEVDRVFSPGQYWRHAVAFSALRGFDRQGALLFLGGDPIHALWLARRLGMPPLAYMERGSSLGRRFLEIFVPDERARGRVLRRGAPPERVQVVGDLMLDAVRPKRTPEAVRAALGLDPARPVVAVFPGSRAFEMQPMVPFFMRVAEILWEGRRDLQFVISLAPFVPPQELDGVPVPGLGGTRVTLSAQASSGEELWHVVTERGLAVPALRGASHDILQIADLALTVPGSNTAEMAALGVPMVVTLPLNLTERVPLPGLVNYLDLIPFVGKRWKRAVAFRAAERMPFTALPNRKAGRAIVPEVRGVLRPEDVAVEAARVLADPKARAVMRTELRQVMGAPGAAQRIAARLQQMARQVGGASRDADGSGGRQPGEQP